MRSYEIFGEFPMIRGKFLRFGEGKDVGVYGFCGGGEDIP